MHPMLRLATLGLLVLGLACPAAAATHFIKWNHGNGSGDERNVAGVDLATGRVLWERKLKKEVNFVIATGAGVLVGSDDGSLYLLRPESGGTNWSVPLGREVNEFHGETEEGFLVSHDKQIYWLVTPDGKKRSEWK